jgi:hypothetical protein
MSVEERVTRIPLPNGDALIPDADFLEIAGGVTARTGNNWDKDGCPFAMIGGRKWRPEKEGLAWIASRIRRRNPPRRGRKYFNPDTEPRHDVDAA